MDLFDLCLFGSWSSSTLIKKWIIPLFVIFKACAVQSFTTTQGTYRFVLDCACITITWDGWSFPMNKINSNVPTVNTSFSCALTASIIYTNSATTILYTKYNQSSSQEVVKNARISTISNRVSFSLYCHNFLDLFSGTLGRYMHNFLKIKLRNPNKLPVFCTTYPVPLVNQ